MSTRKQPTTTPKWPNRIICIGDSLTHNITTQVNLADFWPTRLGVGLTALGAASNGVNLGTSGNTTGQMIGRLYAVTDSNGDPDIEARFGYVPDMAVIFGGVNDPGGTGTVQASPIPTDTVFTLDSGNGDKFTAGCWINVNDATGNAGAAARRVLSVVGDAITLETALASAPAAGATIRNDTYANINEMIDTLDAAGVEKIMVVSTQYRNWATGGDSISTPEAVYAAVRVAQSAVATANSVPYVDLYAHMRAILVADPTKVGDDTFWHVATSDQHLNTYGEQLVADAVIAKIQATTGWLTALSEA